MARKANIHGGGAKTNINGLKFEQTTSLDESFTLAGYKVENHEVYYNDEKIGLSVPKHSFYKNFLASNGINQKDYTSKKWLPDECFVNNKSNCVYIIEKNFKIAVVRSMKKSLIVISRKVYMKNYAPLSNLKYSLFIFLIIGLKLQNIRICLNMLKG